MYTLMFQFGFARNNEREVGEGNLRNFESTLQKVTLEESLSECGSNETSSDIDSLLYTLNSSEGRVDFLRRRREDQHF